MLSLLLLLKPNEVEISASLAVEKKNTLFYRSICVCDDLIGENRLNKIDASSCLSGEKGELIS